VDPQPLAHVKIAGSNKVYITQPVIGLCIDNQLGRTLYGMINSDD